MFTLFVYIICLYYLFTLFFYIICLQAPVLTDKAQEFKDEKEVEVMGESPKKDRVAQNVAASVVSSSSLHDLKDAIESLGMPIQRQFHYSLTACP